MGLDAEAVAAAIGLPPVTHKPGWLLSLYPQAAEGGGCFQSTYRPERDYVARGAAKDPTRAAEEAGRRARRTLRRYCAANGLNRLGTLTYEGQGCHEPLVIREHIKGFFRDVRAGLGGKPLPYVWVPEWHKTDHGLHMHFAFGRYVPRSVISSAWGRGFVHIKLLGDLPVGSGRLSEARRAAGYLSKYVAKTFTDPDARILGLHRYGLAQGFTPTKVSLHGRSADDVLDQASQFFGMAPARRWSSGEVEGWKAPPAIWAQWGR